MRNYEECAEVKSIMLEGMLFFEKYKKQRLDSEITILLVLGKTEFLKLISTCVTSKNPLLFTIDDLKRQVKLLLKDIEQQVSKHLLYCNIKSAA